MKNYIISIATFLCIIVIFIYGVNGIAEKADSGGEETLQKAIQRASVQCYAIEGRFPSSVDYLVENYGIQIDESKYAVFYEGFASNVMPDITVSKL
ncbi:MAG: hypothetical protein ACK5MV_10855 [Aminipila sp.]